MNQPSWVSIMSNPQGYVVKQYMANLLKEKLPPHQEILERLAATLITHNDLEAFGKLISEIYQMGYIKALKDHEEALNKLGYKVSLKQPEVVSKIFPQEKSGCTSEIIP